MTRGFSVVALEKPKNALNVGAIFRAAYCYRASLVIVGSRHTSKKRAPTDTCDGRKQVPTIYTEYMFDALPHNCVPVGVDIVEDARDLTSYIHPPSACYFFGPENGTLSDGVLNRCRDVIYVPTTHCMNLAAAVNVILYDRMAKEKRTRGATG